MASKQIFKFKDIRKEILEAVDMICDPIKETISPKGLNAIFQNDAGDLFSTNDGVTIAKAISVKDPIKGAIIDIIKTASLRTNSEVGDGTSTTIVLAQILIKECLRLVDNGINPTEIKKTLQNLNEEIKESLKKQAIQIKNDNDLLHIATVSANNDSEIAKDIVNTMKIAGLDGMIFIEPNNKIETEIIEETGFILRNGMFAPEFRNSKNKFSTTMIEPLVFLTDKRIYYQEEAETILKIALESGAKKLVVIARDFIGQAVNTFIANHVQGVMEILLIKDEQTSDKNSDSLQDLAAYLHGDVISDKTGSLVNNITILDFCQAAKVFADPVKSIITTLKPNNKELKLRIEAIREELKKDKEHIIYKQRLASLTNGMVTIRVGGQTQIEMAEKIYRYEDAVNATRSAMKDGYLVGGGLALNNAIKNVKFNNSDFAPILKKIAEANIRQIALNCGKHPEFIVETINDNKNINYGYNALTDTFEDLLKAGIIDPYKVTEMALSNAISITNQIITTNHLIVNELEEDNNK